MKSEEQKVGTLAALDDCEPENLEEKAFLLVGKDVFVKSH